MPVPWFQASYTFDDILFCRTISEHSYPIFLSPADFTMPMAERWLLYVWPCLNQPLAPCFWHRVAYDALVVLETVPHNCSFAVMRDYFDVCFSRSKGWLACSVVCMQAFQTSRLWLSQSHAATFRGTAKMPASASVLVWLKNAIVRGRVSYG